MYRSLLSRAFLAVILFTICSCQESGVDSLRPKPPVQHGKSDILFEEDFSRCTLDVGPAVQSDDFSADVENPLSHIDAKSGVWKTVRTSHVCSDDYMNSRGFADWVYLFRVSERPGFLAVGVNPDGKRGIARTPMMSGLQGEIAEIDAEFRVRADDSMTDDLCFTLCLAGLLTSVSIDDAPFDISAFPYNGIEHSIIIPHTQISGGWHKVCVHAVNATDGTMLQWSGSSSSKTLCHGFYLDDIKVIRGQAWDRPEHTLRVLFWNIQNGMWSDQPYGYVNFRRFVERYSPDVCVWCEGQSIYKDHSTTSMAAKDRYFPDGWQAFAASYGHRHVAIGGYRIYADDYYPQVITSRYPITTLELITETDANHQVLADGYRDGASHAAEYHAACGEDYRPVAHGAAVYRVDVSGRPVNFVTLHLWPHAYSYYAKFVLKNNSYDSAQSRGGNAQREAEIRYICSRSVENPAYSDQKDWLMMGDFNTRSRIDNWRYALPDDSAFLSSHDYLLQHTDYQDVIGLRYPGHFFATRTWADDAAGNYPPRYDFMYASPSMYGCVRNATILNESWTNMVWERSNYYNSSDHRPILVDFDLSE